MEKLHGQVIVHQNTLGIIYESWCSSRVFSLSVMAYPSAFCKHHEPGRAFPQNIVHTDRNESACEEHPTPISHKPAENICLAINSSILCCCTQTSSSMHLLSHPLCALTGLLGSARPHIHTQGQIRPDPNMQDRGPWEEREEKPGRQEMNMQTLHRKVLSQSRI